MVSDLWVKVGTTDLTSYIAALQQAKPDLVFFSLLFADMPIFMKQAHAAGLTQEHEVRVSCRRVPARRAQEIIHAGRDDPRAQHHVLRTTERESRFLKEFVRDYHAKYNDWPTLESHRAYSTIAAYKAAVEKASKATERNGQHRADCRRVTRHRGGNARGKFRYRDDTIPESNFYAGFTTHNNKYDFCTIERIETMHTDQLQKPPGADFFKWIETMNWKV